MGALGLPLLALLLLLGVRAGAPTSCEVCKYLSLELEAVLASSARSAEVLELGQVLDSGWCLLRRLASATRMPGLSRGLPLPSSLPPFPLSCPRETHLAEALESVCEWLLQYSVHTECPGSLRYAKGQSQTMSTLRNLVPKGVKVDLGIPSELWRKVMLEHYEEPLEDWYFHRQKQLLRKFLCEGHVPGARAVAKEPPALPDPQPLPALVLVLAMPQTPLHCGGLPPTFLPVACLDEVWTRSKGDHGNQEELEDRCPPQDDPSEL